MPFTLAFCWSHARRKVRDAQRQGTSPIAEEALRRTAALYRIETEIRRRLAEERLAARQTRSAPLVADMRVWLHEQAARLSRKTLVGEAIRYALRHWDGLCVFLEDGRVEIDSHAVERSIKPQILVRKNALFAGADSGAEHWARIASLIETAKLNGLDPQACIRDVLETMVAGFPANRIDDLLPWAWTAPMQRSEPQTALNTGSRGSKRRLQPNHRTGQI
ncbi:IS66 C-terminal element [Rhodospira trueperi]|uniref:IS66 C-terminal element n=1 Tax=Rhodospira trueperi TaxID=69960 RepID=A0A1G6W468_9PROT|nr:IS66 C-terminal element [Rhodospira trueperi]